MIFAGANRAFKSSPGARVNRFDSTIGSVVEATMGAREWMTIQLVTVHYGSYTPELVRDLELGCSLGILGSLAPNSTVYCN
jgi:hypothetical protein